MSSRRRKSRSSAAIRHGRARRRTLRTCASQSSRVHRLNILASGAIIVESIEESAMVAHHGVVPA